jgi:hypothetical protein
MSAPVHAIIAPQPERLLTAMMGGIVIDSA